MRGMRPGFAAAVFCLALTTSQAHADDIADVQAGLARPGLKNPGTPLSPPPSSFVIRISSFAFPPSFLGAFPFEIDSSARKLTMVKVQGEGKK